MTQKLPRNTLLHERNHKRKAGAHTLSKAKAREALWAILRSAAECGEVHHSPHERHEYGEPCPVLERIERAADNLRGYIHADEEEPRPPKTLTNGLSAQALDEWYAKGGK